MFSIVLLCLVFFFNDTATTEIYTLSLHDALPIYVGPDLRPHLGGGPAQRPRVLGLQRVVPVRVVVEEGEVRAPAGPHREPRRQQDPDGVAQSGGPLLRRAERRLRPVDRGHGAADLASTGEQRGAGVLVVHGISSLALVDSANGVAVPVHDLAPPVLDALTRGMVGRGPPRSVAGGGPRAARPTRPARCAPVAAGPSAPPTARPG